jgi:hypothetical protein
MPATVDVVTGTVAAMDVLRRMVGCAIDRATGLAGAAVRSDVVVLRHRPSGLVLTDGVSEPVRFPDHETAEAFGRRFLDERDAWHPVPVVRVPRAA